jgi:hypothetical protein
MSDQQILIDAIEKSGTIIAEHIEPGRAGDPEQTINPLIEVLDTQDVAGAIESGIQIEGVEVAHDRAACAMKWTSWAFLAFVGSLMFLVLFITGR